MRRVLSAVLLGLLLLSCADDDAASPENGQATDGDALADDHSDSSSASSTQSTQSTSSTGDTTLPEEDSVLDLAWGMAGFGPFGWGTSVDEVVEALTPEFGEELRTEVEEHPYSACQGDLPGTWTSVMTPDFDLVFVDDQLAFYNVFEWSGIPSDWGGRLDMTLGELQATNPDIVVEDHFWYRAWWRIGPAYGGPDGMEGWLYGVAESTEPDAGLRFVSGRAPGAPPPCHD